MAKHLNPETGAIIRSYTYWPGCPKTGQMHEYKTGINHIEFMVPSDFDRSGAPKKYVKFLLSGEDFDKIHAQIEEIRLNKGVAEYYNDDLPF